MIPLKVLGWLVVTSVVLLPPTVKMAEVPESVITPVPLNCWVTWAKVLRSYSAPVLITNGLEFGNAAVHPSQLYFAAAGVILFALLWGLRRRMTVPGVLFWTFIVLFGLVRIPLDMTRAYEPEAVVLHLSAFDVTESQMSSLALALFGSLMILRLRRAAPAPA